AAFLAALAHAGGQLQAGDQVGARRAAIAPADLFFQQPHRRDGGRVGYLDHLVDDLEQEAWLDPAAADALDDGGAVDGDAAVVRAPAHRERGTLRLGHAQPGLQAAVTQVAADRGRGPAGAGTTDDPRRIRVRFGRELADDRLGDVVVAAPVGGALGLPELVQVAGAAFGMPGGARVDLARVVDQVDLAAQYLDVGDLAWRGRARHHRGELQPQHAREPGLGDGRAARGGIDHRLAGAQLAVAQRVQVQRTRQPVLEAAGRVRRLVLEVELDVREARELDPQQVRVGRAGCLAAQGGQCVDQPLAGG